jgi:hypothetical protein
MPWGTRGKGSLVWQTGKNKGKMLKCFMLGVSPVGLKEVPASSRELGRRTQEGSAFLQEEIRARGGNWIQ